MNQTRSTLASSAIFLLLLGYWFVGMPDDSDSPLPNLHRVTESVYSGGQPEGEFGFQKLSELGIETVISVDGAQPDVESAKKYGLKYVHLPHGYDGIEEEHAAKLAKAVQSFGQVYIHCHHGHHRSPAAAAVACVGLDQITPGEGRELLEKAGTSPQYKGPAPSSRPA